MEEMKIVVAEKLESEYQYKSKMKAFVGFLLVFWDSDALIKNRICYLILLRHM